MEYRQANGAFQSRKELHSVKGLGAFLSTVAHEEALHSEVNVHLSTWTPSLSLGQASLSLSSTRPRDVWRATECQGKEYTECCLESYHTRVEPIRFCRNSTSC